MKLFPLALATALASLLATGCAPEPADTVSGTGQVAATADAHADSHDAHSHDAHAHDTHAAGIDFPVPQDHVPWAPDAPLVEGMERVSTALDDLSGDPAPDTVHASAEAIDQAVAYMFANCNLPTEPDVALHAVLARLMAGSQALHANPADTTPVADMQAALRNYRQLFDDPLQ